MLFENNCYAVSSVCFKALRFTHNFQNNLMVMFLGTQVCFSMQESKITNQVVLAAYSSIWFYPVLFIQDSPFSKETFHDRNVSQCSVVQRLLCMQPIIQTRFISLPCQQGLKQTGSKDKNLLRKFLDFKKVYRLLQL